MENPTTHQEVFDKVVCHLRKQGEKSLSSQPPRGCAYRGDQGKMCAVGCLISDYDYKTEFEGWKIEELTAYSSLKWMKEFISLLDDLQKVHDQSPSYRWEERLVNVAIKHTLSYVAPAN